MPDERLQSNYISLIPLFLCVAVYGWSLGNGFAGDDHQIIVNFPLIRDVHSIPRFFTMQDTLVEGVATGYYRPLGRLVYMVDYYLWGMNPFGFHLMNLLLHTVTAWGWFLLVRKVSGERIAVIATSLFAIAPVNVESVAFISARNNIQVACLLIYSLHAHIKASESESRHRRGLWGALSLFLFVMALFTKEYALFFPLILMAWHLLAVQAEKVNGWRVHVVRILPYLAAATGFMFLRGMIIGPSRSLLDSVSAASMADSVRSMVAYIRLLVMPLELSTTHDIAYGNSLLSAGGILSAAGVVALLLLFLYFIRHDRITAFFMTWFLIFLFPVSGIFAFNPVPVAERYLYVPSLGAYAVAVLALRKYAGMWKRPVAVLLSCYLLFFMVRSILRTTDWKDDLTLSLSTVKARPDSPVAFQHLGSAYMARGRNDEAVAAFRRSLELNPSFPHARMNLARAYHLKGMLDDAIREYALSLEVMPDDAMLHGAIADAYYQKGLLPETARHLREQLRITPGDERARNNLMIMEDRMSKSGRVK